MLQLYIKVKKTSSFDKNQFANEQQNRPSQFESHFLNTHFHEILRNNL
jgi:hypothetical protein